ncbi:MAG: hypothetical protein QXU79_01015 [Candidatus Micrarchaeaceae archaeon]
MGCVTTTHWTRAWHDPGARRSHPIGATRASCALKRGVSCYPRSGAGRLRACCSPGWATSDDGQ